MPLQPDQQLVGCRSWIDEWAALWQVKNLADKVHIEPGRRLTRSLGRCHPHTGSIRIHLALFDSQHAELFREVVCHEVAHVAVHMLHGRGVRPHGGEWKELVAAAGYPPSARMDPRRLPEQLQFEMTPKISYRHTCTACGATRMAARRVTAWRCRACVMAGLAGLLRIVRSP